MSVDEIFNGIPGSDYQVLVHRVRKRERERRENTESVENYLVNTYQWNVANCNRYFLDILSPMQVEKNYFREKNYTGHFKFLLDVQVLQ
jgi:hypothetical protein